MKNSDNYISEIRPHDSAYKHVSGTAEYTDDIKEPYDTLFGAIGWSKKAYAKIKKIDLNEVINSEGVVSVVNYLDIPGRNDVGPVFDGDPIFVKDKVEFFGQPIFAVAATSIELARKAVLKAKINYIEYKPIVTLKDSLNKKNLLFDVRKINKGNAQKKILKSKHTLKGNFTTGSQEHFYLEGQVAFVIPKEDNEMLVYSSTQHPSETQQLIGKILNQKSNSITVLVRRIGGGFGGKETNFMTAAICSLLAYKTKRPIKLRLDRDDDIILTGKRHEFFSDYEVGFDDKGIIQGLKVKLASKCGMSPDLSYAINERALLHIDNAYFLSDLQVENYLCKTRFNWILSDSKTLDGIDLEALIPILFWMYWTRTGDLSECSGFFNARRTWLKSMICSDSGFCNGDICNRYNGCYYGKLKRAIFQAHVIVINHSLLMTNIVQPGLIPEFNSVIIDEAHNLVKSAYDQFKLEWSEQQVSYLLQTVDPSFPHSARWNNIIQSINDLNPEVGAQRDLLIKAVSDSKLFLKDMMDGLSDDNQGKFSPHNSYQDQPILGNIQKAYAAVQNDLINMKNNKEVINKNIKEKEENGKEILDQ